MSIKHKSETPNCAYGPATGIPTPESKNEPLATGDGHEYTGDCTPGTGTIAQPGHRPGGPGHDGCDHE